ncbi:MAG: hypothetical protein D5R97_09600, partial [Candidatus Syntrophonatronum acetioxidans]
MQNNQGKSPEEIKHKERAEKANEHLKKGTSFLYKEKEEKALEEFKRALEKDSQNTYIHYNIAY